MASSISVAMSGRVAWFWRFCQRASGGTQKTLSAVYSSRLSSRPSSCGPVMPSASSSAFELLAPGREGVGDVLQEEQTEDDVLVLGGVDLAAQGVGGFPEDLGANLPMARSVLLRSETRVAEPVVAEESSPETPAFCHVRLRLRSSSPPCGDQNRDFHSITSGRLRSSRRPSSFPLHASPSRASRGLPI
jgi:hypothetical protein